MIAGARRRCDEDMAMSLHDRIEEVHHRFEPIARAVDASSKGCEGAASRARRHRARVRARESATMASIFQKRAADAAVAFIVVEEPPARQPNMAIAPVPKEHMERCAAPPR